MIKSMTGYGRGNIELTGRSYTIEIKSVNHRYCDLNIKMPKSLLPLEDRIRKVIQSRLNRGKIDVFVTQNLFDKKDVAAVFNKSLGDSYYSCLNEIKERYQLKDEISLTLISKFPDVIMTKQEEEDVEELWESLSIPLNEALDLLLKMREREGMKLKEDIQLKCNHITNMVNVIQDNSTDILAEYQKKLLTRLNDLIKDHKIDENRIAMEAAIIADKASVDEEIVRLKSHLVQLSETMDINEPVGRKLDFIVQEMNRETNTIASKATNLDIINVVLNIKNEIEKVREQIQNIE
ncbi:MAG: YicC/YloC family endoribonuclease [Solirubrobacterales bacterium]